MKQKTESKIARGWESEAYKPTVILNLINEVECLRRLDQEAAEYVESVICMRTDFTGMEPEVGWKGLGIALNRALDERDMLRYNYGA